MLVGPAECAFIPNIHVHNVRSSYSLRQLRVCAGGHSAALYQPHVQERRITGAAVGGGYSWVVRYVRANGAVVVVVAAQWVA